jgi:class 3 adenylate cyclase/tetratricopeptide (TPR) repeat protein
VTFNDVLSQTLVMLQQHGRVSYRALKRQFTIDDSFLEDLKYELIEVQRCAVDQDGLMLVWTGDAGAAAAPMPASVPATPASPVIGHTRALLAYTPPHLAEKILTSRSALEGERKLVTVVFADIVGFTALARQLDPEVVHEIMNHCFGLITAEVHRFEGTINQYTGDGVMALFGAPIAHEDSPRRAVHAALGIQRALQDFGHILQAQRGFRLPMRIGINTGLVVVGKIGDDLRMDYTALGDTTNLAARLQQLAHPGTVVISEATHRLVAGYFETQDLGAHVIKGHPEPVRVVEVLRARGQRTRLDVAAEHGLTPLVGRDRELATLLDRFQQSQAGHGQVVAITGEAGIGKSRLVLEFRRALAQAGAAVTWLEGRCLAFGQTIPFLPIVEQLRANFGIEEADGEPEIIAKVEQGMRRMGGLEASIPAIRYLLSVAPGDETLAAMEPITRRKQLFDAVLALTLRGAQLRPLVLIYEDLHWIDTSTEAFLSTLLDAVAGVSLVLLVTYRVDYTPPFGTRSFHTTLTLPSLADAETLTLASRLLGTADFPDALKAALLEKAEGVPLFVEEVVKTLLDVGVLQRNHEGYRIARSFAEVHVPDTIQGIIMARLDRLGGAGKRTVQLASVIGRQFQVRLLERLVDVTERLDELLAELQALEIIYQRGLLPEPAYAFKHAMVQDVAYNSLLVRRRKELHRAVGDAIEEFYPERLAEHCEELAHHFTQGEAWPKAMTYSTLAGDRAADAFANVEAKTHYGQALQAAEHLTPPADPGVVACLHAKHATILEPLGEYEEAIAAYQHALRLIRQGGDRQGEIDILVGLSGVYNSAHREEPATLYSTQALALARESNDRTRVAVCLIQRAAIRSVASGQIVEATPEAEEALRLARDIGEPKALTRTLVFLGSLLQWRAEFDRSLRYLHEGVELAQHTHAGPLLGNASFCIGNASAAQGAYEEALQWYQKLSDYASAARDTFWLARLPNTIGGVHLELFDSAEALRLNLEGAEIAQQCSSWPEPRGHCWVKAGLAYLHQGEHGPAEACFRRAEDLLEADVWMRWRWHMALLRARGELALAQSRPADAWTYAMQSLALATQSQSRKHIVRAQLLQGEVLLVHGQLEEAAHTLVAAVRLAEQIGTPREIWLGQATLGNVLRLLGQEQEAEAHLTQATQTIEGIATNLRTLSLRRSLLGAAPVVELYATLGRRLPSAILKDEEG